MHVIQMDVGTWAMTVWPGVGCSEYYSQLAGFVSPALHARRVLAVGCGLHSPLLEMLGRIGPDTLRLVDGARVQLADLTGTAFTLEDVGRLRVDALARRLRQANPLVEVETLRRDLVDLGAWEMARLLDGIDLIVVTRNQPGERALLNRWSCKVGSPAVYIDAPQAGRPGRIIWTLPGRTPCYRCIVGAEDHLPPAEPLTDYSPPDVQLLGMVALKICLALLDRGQDSAAAAFFEQMAGRNEVLVHAAPNPDVLPAAQGPEGSPSFAFGAVWRRTAFAADCPESCIINGCDAFRSAAGASRCQDPGQR